VVQPQPDFNDQEDLRAIITELRTEVKELKVRMTEFGEKKQILDHATILGLDGRGALQEPPKRILDNHDETPLAERSAKVQSKEKPETHQIPAGAKESQTAPVPKSRIRYLTSKFDASGTRVETEGIPPDLRKVTDSDADTAFEAKEIIGKDGEDTTFEVTLKSRGLRSLIWKVIGNWLIHEKTTITQKSWEDNDQVWLTEGLYAMHYWTEFEAEANDETFKDNQPHKDLKELLMYIEAVEPEMVKYRRRLETLETIPDGLHWMLFQPGSLIVTIPDLEKKHYQVLQVNSYYYRYLSDNEELELVVNAWAFDWNGSELERRYFEIRLGRFPPISEIRIRDLPCWPIRYMYRNNIGEIEENRRTAIRSRLETRGREMRDHCVRKSGKNKMCNFNGFAERQENDPMYTEKKNIRRKVRHLDTLQDILANVRADHRQRHHGRRGSIQRVTQRTPGHGQP
jgi:hypothetical protein